MVADVGFKKQLWALDPELDVVWDWGSSKWEIWRFPGQGKRKKKSIDSKAFHMMTIQTKERTFRELGADILLALQKGDPRRYTLNELTNYFDQMDDNIERAKRKKFMSDMEWFEKDVGDWWGRFKSQVPLHFGVKPSDAKFLIRTPKANPEKTQIFKVPKNIKVTNAIVGV
jgi:hypothetical protein